MKNVKKAKIIAKSINYLFINISNASILNLLQKQKNINIQKHHIKLMDTQR